MNIAALAELTDPQRHRKPNHHAIRIYERFIYGLSAAHVPNFGGSGLRRRKRDRA